MKDAPCALSIARAFSGPPSSLPNEDIHLMRAYMCVHLMNQELDEYLRTRRIALRQKGNLS